MKKLILVLFSIAPNPALMPEPSKEIFRKHNRKILDEIMSSDDDYEEVYSIDPNEEVFQVPYEKPVKEDNFYQRDKGDEQPENS